MNRKLTGKGLRVRDRMIQETARIIREQGFKQATVRAISERAGVNIASIRYYFGSKDELIGAAIDYLMNNFENIVHYLEKGDIAPEERLFSFMRNYFRLANIHPALPLDFVFADRRASEYVFYLHQLIT
ncbi:MAG: TetR/AcrR family transcriptional regulator [Negativicoccus succinicivorans]|nr:TetR/AcrR family transcriptional regulator [Negativicoccus succinicivorans]